MCGVGENTGVVVSDCQCLFRQSERLAATDLPVFRPTVETKSKLAYARPGKRWAVPGVVRDRLIEQVPRLEELLLTGLGKLRQRAQVQFVGGKVVCRPVGRTRGFGHLQCRLDDPSDARCDFVLKFEHVF
jgi:hypothetical protein